MGTDAQPGELFAQGHAASCRLSDPDSRVFGEGKAPSSPPASGGDVVLRTAAPHCPLGAQGGLRAPWEISFLCPCVLATGGPCDLKVIFWGACAARGSSPRGCLSPKGRMLLGARGFEVTTFQVVLLFIHPFVYPLIHVFSCIDACSVPTQCGPWATQK